MTNTKPEGRAYRIAEVIVVSVVGAVLGGLSGLSVCGIITLAAYTYQVLLTFGMPARFVIVGAAIGAVFGMVSGIKATAYKRPRALG